MHSRCFISWMNRFLNESSEPVIQQSIQMVSLVLFLLNQPFWTNSLIWIISKSFIKTGTCCHLLAGLLSYLLSMTDLTSQGAQKHIQQILFNYQYWPKFICFSPEGYIYIYQFCNHCAIPYPFHFMKINWRKTSQCWTCLNLLWNLRQK